MIVWGVPNGNGELGKPGGNDIPPVVPGWLTPGGPLWPCAIW